MAQEIKVFETLSELLTDLDHENIYGYARKRLVDQFMMMRARILHKPYTGSFELTPLCNFDCKMCYVHLNRKQLNQNSILSAAQWKGIMKQAIDAGIMHADLTGGECLTHPGFEEIYLFLVSHGIKVAVLTNGVLLSSKLIRLFSKFPPSVIQVTLYGSSNAVYEKVTGTAAFDAVMASIKQARHAGLNMRIVITPNRYMHGDEEALLETLHNTDIDYEIGSATLPPRSDTGRSYSDLTMDTKLYARMMKLENDYRISKSSSRSTDRPEYRFRIHGMENIKGLPCSAGTAAFHINWKGEMTPCIPFHTISHPVTDNQFQKAWQFIGSAVSAFTEPAKCTSCAYRSICKTCTAEKTSCILDGPVNDYVCTRLKHMIDMGLITFPSSDCSTKGE